MAAQSKSNSVNGNSSSSSSHRRRLQLLKLRIMSSLNKLSDRDTYHIAVEELDLLCGQIALPQFPAEGIIITIPLFLSCLYEALSASDAAQDQRPVVKKECVRMFGKLASLHGEKLSPHLQRIVPHIMKRLRDPDSCVRDTCVDVMGVLSAKVSPPHKHKTRKRREKEEEEKEEEEHDDDDEDFEEEEEEEEGKMDVKSFDSLNFFAEPLLDALSVGNESRNMQIGASMCLARVLDNVRFNPSPSLSSSSSQRMCPRVLKLLNSPRFHAKAALLPAIAHIVQSGGASTYECLSMVMACVQECLKSKDWGTRKAASETLLAISTARYDHLSLATYKQSVLDALEHCRYDKVKPVRDTVIRSLRAWRSMMDPGSADLDCFEREAECPKGSVHSSVTSSSSSSSLTSKLTSNSTSISSLLTSKLTSNSTSSSSSPSSTSKLASNSTSTSSSSSPSLWCVDSSSQSEEVEMGSWSIDETCTYDNHNSRSTPADAHDVSNTSEKDSALIRRRLARIETQQASILELLQKFMERSDETFLKLDGRIDVIESSMCRQLTLIRRPHQGLSNVYGPDK